MQTTEHRHSFLPQLSGENGNLIYKVFSCGIVQQGVGYAICVIDVYVGMFYNTVIGKVTVY